MSSAPPLGLVDRLVANAVLETTVDQERITDTFSKCSSPSGTPIFFQFSDLRRFPLLYRAGRPICRKVLKIMFWEVPPADWLIL